MATAIGRYELPYSVAASMHNENFEAMLAQIEGDEKNLSIVELPSTEWVVQALISGHMHLLQALDTLNDCLQLGFDKRLQAGNTEFH